MIKLKLSILVYTMYLILFVSELNEMLGVPIFPPKAEKRGISQFTIGIMLGMHPITNILTSIILGKCMEDNGRKPITIFGSLLQMIGLVGQAAVVQLPQNQNNLFIILASISRMLQGIGYSCVSNSVYSLLPQLFPKTFQVYIGNLQILVGIAVVLGSLEGSILYDIGGYELPFLTNGALLILSVIPQIILLPSKDQLAGYFLQQKQLLEESNDSNDPEDVQKDLISIDDQENEKINNVSYLQVFQNNKILFQYLAIVVPSTALTVLNPTYSIYLNKELNIKEEFAGYIFSVEALSYTLICPLISYLLVKCSRRLIIFYGIFGNAIATIIIGNPKYLGVKNSVELQIVSRIITGMCLTGIFIPPIGEFKCVLTQMYPKVNTNYLNDIAAALFNTAFHIGEIIGPIGGSLLVEKIGFQDTCSILGWIMGAQSLIYFIRYFKYFYQKKLELMEEGISSLSNIEEKIPIIQKIKESLIIPGHKQSVKLLYKSVMSQQDKISQISQRNKISIHDIK